MLTQKKGSTFRRQKLLRLEVLEDRRPLSVSPGDIIEVSPVAPLHVTETRELAKVVATFTDSNLTARPRDFTATIDWGDGTSSAGLVRAAGKQQFAVFGKHRYADAGTNQIVVTVEDREGNVGSDPFFQQTNLVSDGTIPARFTDSSLVNPWGLAFGPTTPFWVSDNGTGLATIYDSAGKPQPLVVTIPPPAGSPPGTTSAPTGAVFNGTSDFALTSPAGASRFLFATEDGTISAWGPAAGTAAELEADNSAQDSIYKGLAIGTAGGDHFLYATNFHAGTIDVFDASFHQIAQGTVDSRLADPAVRFVDPNLPAGFAPFGIREIGGNLYVTYALQDAAKEDDVAGLGNGFVDVYAPTGALVSRFASQGTLNSPWGLAVAPDPYGPFSGALLVGNFGDGRVNAFELASGKFLGQLLDAHRDPLAIDGLWALAFGNGTRAGNPRDLFFTAGPDDEQHGLFGKLTLSGTEVQVNEGRLHGIPVPFKTKVDTLFSGAVAAFLDENPNESADAFTALIDWGDGTAPTAGRIVKNHNKFLVIGDHTYTSTGIFRVQITVTEQGASSLVINSRALVKPDRSR